MRQETQVQIGHVEAGKDMSVHDPTVVVTMDGVELGMIIAIQDCTFSSTDSF